MANYYLDIETTGIDPIKDKIITIQLQKLDGRTGEPTEDLVILKEWESNEKKIIQEFIKISCITDTDKFTFIPVGYNLTFEHNFLLTRSQIHKLGG